LKRRPKYSAPSVEVDPDNPDPRIIAEAADAIRRGGVAVFPTQGLYGLAADPFNESAVARIFSLKKRPPEKPILVLIRNRNRLFDLVREIPAPAALLADAFWPGRITILFPARPEIPETLTAGSGKIGIRVPSHPVAAALVEAAGPAITGTSANLSGHPGCSRISDLPAGIREGVDLILDAGPLKGGRGSTVVDATGEEEVRFLREGDLPGEEIRKVLQAGSFKWIDNLT